MKGSLTTRTSIAYFITPHGFGHAARSAAVMNAIYSMLPNVEFHIFTQVPEWFFKDSLQGPFTYYFEWTDVGVAQLDPLREDLPETVRRLEELYPVRPDVSDRLAKALCRADCSITLCDISAVGIDAARTAGIPSVLVENFTWDWIYTGYLERQPELEPFIAYLRGQYPLADYHIQTSPVCNPRPVSLTSSVVAREPRLNGIELRKQIGVGPANPLVLITMGGIEQQYPFLDRLAEYPEVTFLIPAAADHFLQSLNRIYLPHHTPFFHPDLVYAADAVVGKVGYSTLAEVYRSGVPFGYVPRKGNREMAPLVDFVREHIPGFEIEDQDFLSGRWVERIPELVAHRRIERNEENGAAQIARFILDNLR